MTPLAQHLPKKPMHPLPTFHQLQVFATVAQKGGFNRAAASMLLSGATVTEQVKLLERAVGQQLIVRRPGRKGLELTRAGQLLLETSAEVFDVLDDGLTRLEALRDEHKTSVSVGVSPHFGGYPLPSLCADFQRSHPGVQVRTSVVPAAQLIDQVRRGQLDLAVVVAPREEPDIVYEALASYHVVMVGPPHHRLSSVVQAPITALAAEPLITYDEPSFTRNLLRQLAASAGVELRPIWEASSEEGLLEAVGSGLGIALMPYYSAARPVDRGDVDLLRVAGLPIRLDFLLVSIPTVLSPTGLQFREYLLDQRAYTEGHTLLPAALYAG